MFLVHYAVLAACMALMQMPVKLLQALPPAPAASQQLQVQPQSQEPAHKSTTLNSSTASTAAAPQHQTEPQSQEPGQKSTEPNSTAGGTVLVPQQIHKVEPPSPSATAQELEDGGDDLRGEKAFADALDYYRAAMAKADSAVLHNKIGITYMGMLRYDAARHEFERATKMSKLYPEPYNNLGVIEYMHKRYGRAVKRYAQAIKLRDDFASFHSNLGTAYFAEKQYDNASAEYSRALALDPDIFEHKSRSGVSLQLASAEDRAKYEYVIAKMYATTGNAERCLLYLRKAIEDGYNRIDDVYKDREFANLRKDPRFTALMASKSKVLQIPPD